MGKHGKSSKKSKAKSNGVPKLHAKNDKGGKKQLTTVQLSGTMITIVVGMMIIACWVVFDPGKESDVMTNETDSPVSGCETIDIMINSDSTYEHIEQLFYIPRKKRDRSQGVLTALSLNNDSKPLSGPEKPPPLKKRRVSKDASEIENDTPNDSGKDSATSNTSDSGKGNDSGKDEAFDYFAKFKEVQERYQAKPIMGLQTAEEREEIKKRHNAIIQQFEKEKTEALSKQNKNETVSVTGVSMNTTAVLSSDEEDDDDDVAQATTVPEPPAPPNTNMAATQQQWEKVQTQVTTLQESQQRMETVLKQLGKINDGQVLKLRSEMEKSLTELKQEVAGLQQTWQQTLQQQTEKYENEMTTLRGINAETQKQLGIVRKEVASMFKVVLEVSTKGENNDNRHNEQPVATVSTILHQSLINPRNVAATRVATPQWAHETMPSATAKKESGVIKQKVKININGEMKEFVLLDGIVNEDITTQLDASIDSIATTEMEDINCHVIRPGMPKHCGITLLPAIWDADGTDTIVVGDKEIVYNMGDFITGLDELRETLIINISENDTLLDVIADKLKSEFHGMDLGFIMIFHRKYGFGAKILSKRIKPNGARGSHFSIYEKRHYGHGLERAAPKTASIVYVGGCISMNISIIGKTVTDGKAWMDKSDTMSVKDGSVLLCPSTMAMDGRLCIEDIYAKEGKTPFIVHLLKRK